jgi:hypothetical protein
MFARKVVPILLVAGAVHMVMHHSQRRCEEQPGDKPAEGGHAHGPMGHRGPFVHRGDWANRVPPMFEMLHNRAHAAQTAAQASSAAPAI